MRCLRCGDNVERRHRHTPKACEARLDEKIARRVLGYDTTRALLARLFPGQRYKGPAS